MVKSETCRGAKTLRPIQYDTLFNVRFTLSLISYSCSLQVHVIHSHVYTKKLETKNVQQFMV